MNYIILWSSRGNEGAESHYAIASEGTLQDKLNSVANYWGNSDLRCFELGAEVKFTQETICKIAVRKP